MFLKEPNDIVMQIRFFFYIPFIIYPWKIVYVTELFSMNSTKNFFRLKFKLHFGVFMVLMSDVFS